MRVSSNICIKDDDFKSCSVDQCYRNNGTGKCLHHRYPRSTILDVVDKRTPHKRYVRKMRYTSQQWVRHSSRLKISSTSPNLYYELRVASILYLLVANTTVAYIGMLLDRAYFIDRLVTEFNLSMIHPMSGNMFASYITTHSM